MLTKIARWLLRNNPDFKALDSALDGDGWDYAYYSISNKKNGLAFWVCNGVSFLKIEKPLSVDLSPLMRFALWGKIKSIIRRNSNLKKVIRKLNEQKQQPQSP